MEQDPSDAAPAYNMCCFLGMMRGHEAEYLTWITNAVVDLTLAKSIGQMKMLTDVN